MSVTFQEIVNPWFYLTLHLAYKVFLTPYHIFAFLKIKKKSKNKFSHIGDFPKSNQLFVIHMKCIVQKIVQIRSAILDLSCSQAFFTFWPHDLDLLTFDLENGSRTLLFSWYQYTMSWLPYSYYNTPKRVLQTDRYTDRQTDRRVPLIKQDFPRC